MSRLPIPHIINTIKTKLGFDRTMTAPGEDVVDAVNKHSAEIDNVQAATAYVENGDKASQTYKEGQFILWKGLLYTVKTGGMPKNETISTTTYLDLVTGGGLNSLKSKITEWKQYNSEHTTDKYGVIETNIPITNIITGPYFSNLVLLPFRKTSGYWAFMAVDLDSNHMLVSKPNKTANLVFYYA